MKTTTGFGGMGREVLFWTVAGVTVLAVIASCAFDIVLAARISEIEVLRPIRAVLFVGFALQIIATGCLSYYCLLFARISVKHKVAWIDVGTGAGFNAVALAAAGVGLIWLTCRTELPKEDHGIRDAALVLWALSIVLNIAFFVLVSTRTRRIISKNVPRVHVQNFGITLPPVRELALGTRPSFCSRETTLASSRPCTPTSSRTYSLPSSSTKIGTSIRSKLTRNSAKSSLELPPFPAGEASALGSAFDRYDTSAINHEMRNTILSSSPAVNRTGLEPIPGSRPESPEDEPTLPTSPKMQLLTSSPPSAGRSSALEAFPSPPSSPPNFSRPTSRGQQTQMSPSKLREPRMPASMTDLIHPLFRPESPNHPQILTMGTMVTASPLANQPISPKTLHRLRSASDMHRPSEDKENIRPGAISLTSKGQWRVMPSVDDISTRPRSRSHSSLKSRPSTAGSDTNERPKTGRKNSIGSPGPSIIEEDELPPILPGFVLSAGSRSSLVGYGKRKSVKRSSAHLG